MRLPLAIICIAFLGGCVTPAPRNAEVTIPAPLAKVRESAIAFLIANEWRPTRSDELVMVFQKAGRASDVALVDPGAKQQITLTLMNQTNAVRLIGFGAHIYHFGERTHNDIAPGIQWHLEGIKATTLGQPVTAVPKPERLPPARTGKGPQ